jgi:hypothetical protein
MSPHAANDPTAKPKPPELPQIPPDANEEEEPSISGTGCLLVIAASIIVSALLYVFVMSRNPDTRGPAYIAASGLFGFFVVGIIWGVIQQQRESDRARDAEESTTDSAE